MPITPASEVTIPRAARAGTPKPSGELSIADQARQIVLETEIDVAVRAAKSSPIVVPAQKADVTNQALVDALTKAFRDAGWSLVARKGRDNKPTQWEVRKAKAAKTAATAETPAA